MSLQTNLSVRYINALRQLPQYQCNVDRIGPVTHVLTGARISPVGDLHDEDDSRGILAIEFPGVQCHPITEYQPRKSWIRICLQERTSNVKARRRAGPRP